jgi:isoleucyl-tRNA synthetase
LNVSDRVRVAIDGPADFLAQLATHREMIAGEVLATSVLLETGSGEPQHVEAVVGAEVRIWMAVAS